MRCKILLALSAVTGALLFAQPAAAQGGYYDRDYDRQACERENRDRVMAGVVVGAIVGGVLGNNVAAGGHQGDGTLLGGALGGLTGGALASRRSYDCDRDQAYRDDDYYGGDYSGGDEGYYSEDPYDGAYADDGYYADDDRLLGAPPPPPSRSYARTEDCRWGDMNYVDADGRSQGSERVWMCMGRDGVWRPAE